MEKALYKIEMGLLKVIPMVIAFLYLLNTVLSYFYIEAPVLSLIGGLSILPMVFLYVSSFAFHFCSYHRMFIYYVAVCDVISYLDYYYELPISNRDYLLLHITIAGLFLFIILYLKLKICNHSKTFWSNSSETQQTK